MSLDNIQLSNQICEILYSHNLIEDFESHSDINSVKKNEIESLGENQSNILFIVNDPAHKFLPDEEMELLTRLVSACQLSLADIALVNFNSNKYNYQQYNERFQPKKILIFGVKNASLELPFDIPHFQVQQFQQQFYLTAPSLNALLNNTALKKELWGSLQKLFL